MGRVEEWDHSTELPLVKSMLEGSSKVLAVDNQDSSNRTRQLLRLVQYPHLQRKQAGHRFSSRRQAWATGRTYVTGPGDGEGARANECRRRTLVPP